MVFIHSCKNNQESQNIDIAATNELIDSFNDVDLINSIIIIQNDTEGDTISFFRDLNFSNFSEKGHIYTNKKNDTLTIYLKQSESLFVASNKHQRDTILVNVGDTIFIQNGQNDLSWIGNYDEKKVRLDKQLIETSSKQIDSLTNLFYHIDYNAPFNLYSKFEKLAPIYPLVINQESFKNNSTDLLLLVNLRLDRLSLIEKKYDSIIDIFPANAPYYKLLKEQAVSETYLEVSRLYRYSKNKDIKKIISSERFINSKLEHNSNNYTIMNGFITNVVLDGHRIRSKNRLKVEYVKAFDSVSNYIDNKDLLPLFKILSINEAGREGGSKKEIAEMVSQFGERFPDNKYNTYLSKIENDYSLKFSLNFDNTEDVNLQSFDNSNYVLKDILSNNKGKVIYIDFWASWCAPCRDVMPDAKKLANQFLDKDVTFIYLSIDDNKSLWEKASIEEELDKVSTNFLVLNYGAANLFKELKLQTIPRYILFNKNGELVHQNASGPDSDEIRSLLNKYLKE